jgi:hypothetical protein
MICESVMEMVLLIYEDAKFWDYFLFFVCVCVDVVGAFDGAETLDDGDKKWQWLSIFIHFVFVLR